MILYFVLAVAFISCNKNNNCPDSEKHTNSGIIFSDASAENRCVSVKEQGNYVITNQIDYEEIELIEWIDTCKSKKLNPIDFTNYTLLGMFARGRCRVNFEREVISDSNNQKYIYTIKVNECGNCETNYEHMNWVLVPKLPDNWTVEFILK